MHVLMRGFPSRPGAGNKYKHLAAQKGFVVVAPYLLDSIEASERVVSRDKGERGGREKRGSGMDEQLQPLLISGLGDEA